MEMKKKKSGKKPRIVKKPYLIGAPVDGSTVKGALGLFGVMIAMAILFLLLGAVFMFENTMLRLAANGVVMAVVYMMFYSAGSGVGAGAVNHGEIMYNRRETGREVTDRELARCYHPLKGFIAGLLGVAPVLVCAVILAMVTRRQMSGIGAMPSWTNGLTNNVEFGAAVAFYSVGEPFDLETVMRMIVRMSMMPIVNIFNASDADAMLLMERLSPVFALLPAVSYGLGYTRGVDVRTRVHTDIAHSKRKRARKANAAANKPARTQQTRVRKGPEQLN